jgi:hypothetical protein
MVIALQDNVLIERLKIIKNKIIFVFERKIGGDFS